MDSTGYGVAAMRRGSYDDAAASLRPVSIDLHSEAEVKKILSVMTAECDSEEIALSQWCVVMSLCIRSERSDCWLT